MRRLRSLEPRRLPRGKADLLLQVALFALCYGLYELVRGLVAAHPLEPGAKPFVDATRIIDFERSLHVFFEPHIQAWAVAHDWIIDAADWIYLNAHLAVTVGALSFIYLRRNSAFYFVRNMFVIAMGIALVGYAAFPTAPPRLMPAWGFVDTLGRSTGLDPGHGAANGLVNLYAAVPSMHVCIAAMVGVPLARLVGHPLARAAWILYPPAIIAIVLITANHYELDVLLGLLTALAAGLLSETLLARARPRAWAFGAAPA